MKSHDLKAHMQPFGAMWDESKTAEFRKNDRDYQIGDSLFIREIDENYLKAEQVVYTGRAIAAVVTHVLKDAFGVPKDYAMLSFKIENKIEGETCTF